MNFFTILIYKNFLSHLKVQQKRHGQPKWWKSYRVASLLSELPAAIALRAPQALYSVSSTRSCDLVSGVALSSPNVNATPMLNLGFEPRWVGSTTRNCNTKFYMMTTLGYIPGLDLATACFFNGQLPDEAMSAQNSRNGKFSGGLHSELYLVDANGLQLCIWHGDGAGQWVLVGTMCAREACDHLNLRRWKPDDGCAAPVKVVAVTDNAEFVILELVASEIVCWMQVGNKVVQKMDMESLEKYTGIAHPVTIMVNKTGGNRTGFREN